MKTHILQKWLIDNKPQNLGLTEWKNTFARDINITKSFLDMVITGKRAFKWPQTVNKIIFATGGAITTGDLRPDIVEAIVSNASLIKEVNEKAKEPN
jgi:DNA-binding transcriptional regulator YdaS (Cro superfamily)